MSGDPLTINLYYKPSGLTTRAADAELQAIFHFRITVPSRYPFRPPSFKWVSRPPGPPGHSPFLGPHGDVSVPALSQWTPASSLANVLLALFPSAPLAAQCCRATSHLWLLGVSSYPAYPLLMPSLMPCMSHWLFENNNVYTTEQELGFAASGT